MFLLFSENLGLVNLSVLEISDLHKIGLKLQKLIQRYHKIRELEMSENSLNTDLVMERSKLTNNRIPEEFSNFVSEISISTLEKDQFRDLSQNHYPIGSNISRIEEYVNEYMEVLTNLQETVEVSNGPINDKQKVFIVHGHDNSLKYETSSFLKDFPNIEPIILHEQVSRGNTIIEKFEEYSNVEFAVILLSPDDINLYEDMTTERARQNVVLELGYFVGKMGRGKVSLIKKGNIEFPSDVQGVVYLPYDSPGKWKIDLAREMKDAGLDIDLNYVKT